MLGSVQRTFASASTAADGEYVLAVGRLTPEKGFADVVEACNQREPPARGRRRGPGTRRGSRPRRQTARFVGHVSADRLAELRAAAARRRRAEPLRRDPAARRAGVDGRRAADRGGALRRPRRGRAGRGALPAGRRRRRSRARLTALFRRRRGRRARARRRARPQRARCHRTAPRATSTVRNFRPAARLRPPWSVAPSCSRSPSSRSTRHPPTPPSPRRRPSGAPWRSTPSRSSPSTEELGAGIYQTTLKWDEVASLEPLDAKDVDDPSYEWPDEIDTAIAEAKSAGLQVALTVTGTPSWSKADRRLRDVRPGRRQALQERAPVEHLGRPVQGAAATSTRRSSTAPTPSSRPRPSSTR